ncbi:MAG: ribonuclease [Patescibacteria group bacterium]|nr:ribonuclease [Patescibacteria group bacterium]
MYMRIGIDEVGRGALAGPLYVCAFGTDIPDKSLLSLFPKKILKDSKKLNEKGRLEIFKHLSTLRKEGKVIWKIGKVTPKTIDSKGVTNGTRNALTVAIKGVSKNTKNSVFLDGGLKAPETYTKQTTIIKGDEKIPVIACASIVAKVLRDSYMKKLAKKHTNYGFEKHVGYGTKAHIEAILIFGKMKEHRELFLRKITKN